MAPMQWPGTTDVLEGLLEFPAVLALAARHSAPLSCRAGTTRSCSSRSHRRTWSSRSRSAEAAPPGWSALPGPSPERSHGASGAASSSCGARSSRASGRGDVRARTRSRPDLRARRRRKPNLLTEGTVQWRTVQAELARERQQSLLAAAAAQRDGQRAWMHERIAKRAQRAERLQSRRADQAARLRAALEHLESAR